MPVVPLSVKLLPLPEMPPAVVVDISFWFVDRVANLGLEPLLNWPLTYPCMSRQVPVTRQKQ